MAGEDILDYGLLHAAAATNEQTRKERHVTELDNELIVIFPSNLCSLCLHHTGVDFRPVISVYYYLFIYLFIYSFIQDFFQQGGSISDTPTYMYGSPT